MDETFSESLREALHERIPVKGHNYIARFDLFEEDVNKRALSRSPDRLRGVRARRSTQAQETPFQLGTASI